MTATATREAPAAFVVVGPRTNRAKLGRPAHDLFEQGAGMEGRTSAWPSLSESGSVTAGGAAAALVLATSRRLASTGRFELGGDAVVVAVRAIRAREGRGPEVPTRPLLAAKQVFVDTGVLVHARYHTRSQRAVLRRFVERSGGATVAEHGERGEDGDDPEAPDDGYHHV
jgi:hypothetical protein